MALVLKSMYRGYFYLFDELSDSRSDNLPLSNNVWQPIIVVIIYFQLVMKILPKYMENRPPYDLKKIIILFNLFQVVSNIYIFYKAAKEAARQSWVCAPIDYSNSQFGLEQLNLVWFYYMNKITDLVDTVFFVLRKKQSHLTFLHLYHHAGMVGLGWIGTKYLGGGQGIYLGLLNALVHVCMYSYYLMSALDDEWKKLSASFKKFITQMQIIQFVTIFCIFVNTTIFNECGYPRIVSFFLATQALFFVLLFGDFYYKSYIKKSTKQHEK